MPGQTNPFVQTPEQPVVPEVVPETVVVNTTPQSITGTAPLITPPNVNPLQTAPPSATTAVVGAVVPVQGAVSAIPEAPMQPEGVMDLTFDDDIQINSLEKLPKLKKEETARIGFVLFNEKGAPLIKMSHYFYDGASKKLFLAPKNKEVLAHVINKLGEPKIRFGTPVILYQTDQYGNLPAQWSYAIHAFVFSTDKFPILKSLHKEWGFDSHDVLMTCTESEYQKLSMNIARECLWRTLPAEFLSDIQEKATLAYEKHINRMMGRPMPDAEILSILGMGGPAQPVGVMTPNMTNPFMNSQTAPLQAPVQSTPGGQVGQVPPQAPVGQAPMDQLAGQVGTGTPVQAEFSNLVQEAPKSSDDIPF